MNKPAAAQRDQATLALQAPAKSGRIVQLDVLRGVAICWVFIAHWPEGMFVGQFPRSMIWIWAHAAHMGWCGVDLFFVLSGYLIGGLLFREYQKRGSVRPGRFLIRRGFKIYPLFWVMLAISILIDPRCGHDYWRVIVDLAYLQNYFHGIGIMGQAWSLAVEEHFYLGIALLTWWAARHGWLTSTRIASAFVFVLCIAILIYRYPTWQPTSAGFDNYMYTHARIDALLFGVWLAHLMTFRRDRTVAFVRRLFWVILTAGIGLIASGINYSDHWKSTGMFTVNYLGFGLILLALTDARAARVCNFGPLKTLAHVGAYSYAIYLTHELLIVLLFRFALPPVFGAAAWLLNIIVIFWIMVGFSVMLSKAVEIPLLKLRDRAFPSLA